MAQEIADSTLLNTWGSGGLKVEPDISKIIEGWQFGEQPPHEYMNWLQNTFGSKLNHILKNGIAEWNNETEYLTGSSVQHSGSIWLCETTNTNSEPTDSNNNWDKIPSIENLALTVDTIDDFLASATTGDTCIVKDLDRGGVFIYDSTKVIEDNGGTNFNGWIRQYSGAVNVKWFGAKGDGVTDDTVAFENSIATNKNVYIPMGTYLINGSLFHAVNYQCIFGEGIGKTTIIVPINRRGQTFKAVDKIGIRLSDMTIDTDNGNTEGALLWSGIIDGLIERVEFLNGDLTSMLIAGNSHLLPSTQSGNNTIVRDCIARGQKRYTPGGTSPFIAGDQAYNTTFINCYVEDCNADAYDSDESYNTKFINCKAIATDSPINYYGFWSEGETYATEVTFDNCYVKNYSGGVGVSEKVRAVITNCKFEDINISTSSRAVWLRNDKAVVKNCIFINCYPSTEANTNAAVLFEKGGEIENCRFEGCNGLNAIIAYDSSVLTNHVLNISDCYFNNAVLKLGYTNTGAKYINISNCTFEDAYISNYSTLGKYIKTEKCIFNQTSDLNCISTSRVARHLVRDCFFNFVGTTSTKPAVECTLDNYNTTIEDCYFDSFNSNVSNATFKKGNIVINGTAQLNYEPENILLQAEVDIVEGGTFYAIPNLSSATAGLLIVTGDTYDYATSVVSFSDKSLGASNGNYNILSESSDYGTADYWKFDYTAPNGIRITHPTTGRKAKIVILKLIKGMETNRTI